jgi:hypothetical protein
MYEAPIKRDMAVGLIYFNSTGSIRILQNMMYVMNSLELSKIPCFVLELCFDNSPPEIANADVVLRASTVSFQKENLCRILESHIPRVFSKLMFIDGDLIFSNPAWYNETSEMLDCHDVVQPFREASWMDITFKKSIKRAKTAVLHPLDWPFNPSNYHPGFAWAFDREWYRRVGFYDRTIIGGGDTLSVMGWMGNIDEARVPKALRSSYTDFVEKISDNPPSIGWIVGRVYHLYHGSIKNRQYKKRKLILEGVGEIDDIVVMNEDGVYEVVDEEIMLRIRTYLSERDDDGIDMEISSEKKDNFILTCLNRLFH